MRTQSESDLVRTVFAGIASITAATATHPLETVKVRLQVQGETALSKEPYIGRRYDNLLRGLKVVYQHEGLRGVYKGTSAAWLRESSYSTLRLGLYEPFKRLLGATNPDHTPIYKKFIAASGSGLVGSALASPTDLLKIRMQAWDRKPHGLLWHIRAVYQNRGITGFYRGVTVTVVRATILNGTKLATYDHTKHTLLNNKLLSDGKLCHFVCSVCAGICMALTTAPADIVKTRIMNQKPQTKVYKGPTDCLVKTVKNEGLFALYKGFTPQWMRHGPFTILQLMVWEQLRAWYGIRGV